MELPFFPPSGGEAGHFSYNRFHRAASLLAPHQRDRTEGTIAITAFGDLHIGTMGFSETEAWRVCVIQVGRFANPEPLLPFLRRQQVPADFRNLSELTGSNHRVEFRQLLEQVSLISLRQTTGGNQ